MASEQSSSGNFRANNKSRKKTLLRYGKKKRNKKQYSGVPDLPD
jgi:hypothetical protein